jgi:glycosyltransferase involved in cell wall biosynthesis
MKILFIARTYPPLVGGMEKFAEDFYKSLSQKAEVTLIANRIGKKYIIVFFFKVLFFLIANARRFDIIHFNDAILSPLIPVIHIFSNVKVTVTVHGLDIVYDKFGYQKLIIPFLRKADFIIAVSRHTRDQCLARNISQEKLMVIPNGLNFSTVEPCSQEAKQSITSKIGKPRNDQVVLLSLGRLIKRKGHTWFIENVFGNLPNNYVYLIAGDGSEFTEIKSKNQRLSLHDRVKLLGYVTAQEKACLFKMADLFIMPNIHDQNDQEGFGIVLLEAASHGLPSIATNIEGISDAIIHGVTGFLVEEKDTAGFIDAIQNPKFERGKICEKVQANYDWAIINEMYHNLFLRLISK